MADVRKQLTREERREAEESRRRNNGAEPISVAELLQMEFPPSSEDRLEALGQNELAPQEFVRATRTFAASAGLDTVVARRASELIGNWREMRFAYHQLDGCEARLEAGEALVVALVLESGNVIGYGYAEPTDTGSHIAVIEVEDYSTRSCGLRSEIEAGDQVFSIGVGHVVVDSLTQSLATTITTDATNGSSRFIFKSLGFSRVPGESNPCLLWFPR